MNKNNYIAPVCELCEINVEGVFCSSLNFDNENYAGDPSDDSVIF